MIRLEVLVEGASDVPAIKEVLQRKLGLVENAQFRIHPHRGKGKLPANPLKKPDLNIEACLISCLQNLLATENLSRMVGFWLSLMLTIFHPRK